MKTYLWIIIGCTAAGAFYPFLTNFHWFSIAQFLSTYMCYIAPMAILAGALALVVRKAYLDFISISCAEPYFLGELRMNLKEFSGRTDMDELHKLVSDLIAQRLFIDNQLKQLGEKADWLAEFYYDR